MLSRPRNLTGVHPFTGAGLDRFAPLGDGMAYRVPPDRRAQAIYLRAGNSADALVCLAVLRDGAVMRLFPVGARASVHVPLAVLEDLEPDTLVELALGAPEGVAGQVVVDFGLMEV